jgi:glycosyltransferase involved in cell wall biosynthesis
VPRPQLAKHQRLHAVIRPFIRRMLHDAAAVTAVSVGLRDAALALAPRLELEVIPNGVDTRLFVSRSAPADAAELNQLLFVGRLREFKGVQYIINALAAVERGLKRSVRLTIVGDGPHKSRLMNLARKLRTTGVQSEVRFLGWIEPAAVRDIYAASSVVVLPSLVEGHPNVLLEGMACGLPCVASDVPGTREVMTQDCGVLVPPEDSESMAAAIVSVLGRMDDWRKMGRAARVRAEAFSWDAVADRYELLLRKVVESRA